MKHSIIPTLVQMANKNKELKEEKARNCIIWMDGWINQMCNLFN